MSPPTCVVIELGPPSTTTGMELSPVPELPLDELVLDEPLLEELELADAAEKSEPPPPQPTSVRNAADTTP
jgi:hypothetical protein